MIVRLSIQMHFRLKKKKKTNKLYLDGAVSVCYSTRVKRACLKWVTVGFSEGMFRFFLHAKMESRDFVTKNIFIA